MSKNSNAYVATLMNRVMVGEDTFIFYPQTTILGCLDTENHIFRDRNGNEYLPMLEAKLLKREISVCYFNQTKLDDLKKIYNVNNIRDAISEFDFACSKSVFLVGSLKDDATYCFSLNYEDIRQQFLDLLNKKALGNTDNNLNPIKNTGAVVNNQDNIDNEMDDFFPDEEYMDDMNPDIKALVLDIVNGKYTIDELRDIKSQLEANENDITDALLTIDVQIESMSNGDSSITMTEEELNAAKEKLREEKADEILANIHKNFRKIDIDDLYKKVTSTLIAQDRAARRVIAEIARKEEAVERRSSAILLTGPTGVGKSKLMSLISEYLNKPFIKIDSNQLTRAGYVGKDIEEYLWDLYTKCGGSIEETEQAIVFFDEIDKKGSDRKDDPSGTSVINSLLTFIEGETYDACLDTKTSTKRVKINTKNMIKVLAGAYTDVYETFNKNNSIGFGNDKDILKKEPTVDDFVKRGLMTKEYMGRVVIVKLDALDVDSLRKVLLESDSSALKIQEDIFRKLGTKIKFTDNYITKVASRAYENGTGARGLGSIVDESTWEAFEEVHKSPNVYSEVILDEDSVEDSSNYQLVKKQNKNISC
jgi:ATP-dependent Clp protease ATP-binding subunit ClpX